MGSLSERPTGVAFRARVEAGRQPILVLLPLALFGLLLLARGAVDGPRPSFGTGALPTDPATILATASDKMAARTAKRGAGFTFTVLQRTSLDQRPGGPAVEVPDPRNPGESLGTTDHLEITSLMARGAARAGGDYWLEMREGPAPGETTVDLEGGEFRFGALVQDGELYRDDGDGWYATTALPGIGLDPGTIALLPAMLKGVAGAQAMTEPRNLAASAVAGVRGTTTAASLPGLIAPDALGFTELSRPLELGFDAEGRLASIHAIARNTNLDGYDMLVDTTITFSYPILAPDIPKPEPLIDPNAVATAKG